MSARQAFVPRPPSCTPSSETHPHSTDVRERDGDSDMFVNGSGKARSIAAFLGQKRGTGTDAGSQAVRPTQGPSLVRANSNAPRRSFEGLLRPEMTPVSIIPYPATTQQLGPGGNQPGVGQTPRKTAGQGALEFEFARPITPTSIQRGLKKGFGIFAEGRDKETIPNENPHGSGVVFRGPGGEMDVRASAGAGIGGYMRVFEGSGGSRSAGGAQSSLEHDITAPVPVSLLGGLDANAGDVGCEADSIFARSSRSLDAMSETEVGMERINESQRSFGGTKRGMRPEDLEENGWYTDNGHQAQGSSKRMKQVQHNPDEYLPISSPHVPQTPTLPSSSVDVLDPSLLAAELFENIGEYINLEEIEADWKRWRECSTEEWLKGADKLAQDYTDILNMVKDHLTEKVMAYASMISSVDERRTEVNRNIEMIHGKGNIVRENISKLGTKK